MSGSTSARATAAAMGATAIPGPRPHYRRSVQTRAPRKRTFIYHMSKYNPMLSFSRGGNHLMNGDSNSSSIVSSSTICCCYTSNALCCGGGDGDNKDNNGGQGRIPPTSNSGGNSNNNDDGRSANIFNIAIPRNFLLGGAVLLASLFFAPNNARAANGARDNKTSTPNTSATSTSISGSPASIAVASAGCSRKPAPIPNAPSAGSNMPAARNTTTKTTTNNKNNNSPNPTKNKNPTAIVYGNVDLTEKERRMLSNNQMHFREMIRVN